MTIEILNLHKTNLSGLQPKAKISTAQGEIDLLKSTIDAYDKKVTEVAEENTQLRDSLLAIQTYLQGLVTPDLLDQESTSVETLLRSHDYASVRDKIEARFKVNLDALKTRLAKAKKK